MRPLFLFIKDLTKNNVGITTLAIKPKRRRQTPVSQRPLLSQRRLLIEVG
jgi:hypothetical protein